MYHIKNFFYYLYKKFFPYNFKLFKAFQKHLKFLKEKYGRIYFVSLMSDLKKGEK